MANDGGAAEYTRDAEFWLEDGTVILVAGDVEFRVYSGLLAKHSPRLKELFSDTQCTRTLLVDGRSEISCPVVCLTDSPDDLRHLLRAYMPQDASKYEFSQSLCSIILTTRDLVSTNTNTPPSMRCPPRSVWGTSIK